MNKILEKIKTCMECSLCEGRCKPVLGEGNLNSELVFIGEAPGRKEDEVGRPFVGSAGQLLDRLLFGIGLSRKAVYISNVVKCRPPDNRRPTIEEMEACTPFLEEQLEIIKPKIIVAMGNSAISFFSKKFGFKVIGMWRIHGKIFQVEAPWGKVILFATFHPAAALYNKDLEKILEDDFKKLSTLLKS
ncbi:uracil-DNA glycosylase [Candidatus Bathyarchaeota archaeon]|nr:uracil-DNA glycosylase [Candidatus Bathyarchaeota archaeon]MBS7630382.1 uracil-DNA glycosylase [Candidatus Bathyarchaeota archaeon]